MRCPKSFPDSGFHLLTVILDVPFWFEMDIGMTGVYTSILWRQNCTLKDSWEPSGPSGSLPFFSPIGLLFSVSFPWSMMRRLVWVILDLRCFPQQSHVLFKRCPVIVLPLPWVWVHSVCQVRLFLTNDDGVVWFRGFVTDSKDRGKNHGKFRNIQRSLRCG